jgi:hypothetical protein
MARIIPFYVPMRLRDRLSRWARPGSRAKILHFIPGYRGKYVWLPSGALWPVLHQTQEGAEHRDREDIAG